MNAAPPLSMIARLAAVGTPLSQLEPMNQSPKELFVQLIAQAAGTDQRRNSIGKATRFISSFALFIDMPFAARARSPLQRDRASNAVISRTNSTDNKKTGGHCV